MLSFSNVRDIFHILLFKICFKSDSSRCWSRLYSVVAHVRTSVIQNRAFLGVSHDLHNKKKYLKHIL